MSDPFSVSVSVLTVLGAGISVSKALKTIIQNYKDAPSEIIALSKEVEDVTLILREINNQQAPLVSGASLDLILSRADGKLAELKDFTAKLGVLHTNGTAKRTFEKLKWTNMKEKSRELLTALRDVKINLGLVMDNSNFLQGAQIQFSVDSLSSNISSLSSTNENQHDAICTHLDNQNRQLVEISRDLNASIPVRDGQHREVLNLLEHQVQSSEQNGELIREIINFMQASQPRGVATTQATYGPTLQPTTQPMQPQPDPNIAIQLRRRKVQREVCAPMCPCRCHKPRRFRTPRFLDYFMGALSVSYSGLPLVNCDNSACWSRTSMSTSATYFFPTWFLNRALFVAMANSIEPSVSLKVLRLVVSHVPRGYIGRHISQEATLMAIKETQRLFEERVASPNDIDARGRTSLLHDAITHVDLDFCKFLLDAGADMDLWTEPTFRFLGRTANESAHLIYLSRGRYEILAESWPPIEFEFDEASLKKLFEIFHLSPEEFLVEQNFPRLHKAVMSGDYQVVYKELALSTKDIDMLDQYGYPASFWAAIRLDTTSLELLLQFGATDTISLITLVTLYTANHDHHHNRLMCMCILIKYMRRRMGAKYLEMGTGYGGNALTQACVHGYYGITTEIRILLHVGAKVHGCNRYGQSPLYWAVYWNSHSVIQALLDNGLSAEKFTRKNFWRVLVIAQEFADVATLQLLISAQFTVPDLTSEDWLHLEIPLKEDRRDPKGYQNCSKETRNELKHLWKEFITGLQERAGYPSSARFEEDPEWAEESEHDSDTIIYSEIGSEEESNIKPEANNGSETQKVSDDKGRKLQQENRSGSDPEEDNNSVDDDFEDAIEFHET